MINVNLLPALTREQVFELYHSGYKGFTPTLNEVERSLARQKLNRGRDCKVYRIINEQNKTLHVRGFMLQE